MLSQSRVRSRVVPAAVKRHIWGSAIVVAAAKLSGPMQQEPLPLLAPATLQIDHILPFALGGSAEPGNLRLLCAVHHRHRHSGRLNPASIAQDQIPTAMLYLTYSDVPVRFGGMEADIKTLRERLGLTQTELAKAVGAQPITVAR